MITDLISVIVPMYNVEKYISECLDSILKQSYDNIEIIVVDDGSTDNGGNICKQYAKGDGRIKVIHTDNLGVSAARNKGVEMARGGWISFVDSDDRVEVDYLKNMYKLALLYQAEIVQSSNSCENYKEDIIEVMSGREFLKTSYFKVMAWGKLYQKRLFEGIKYPVGRIHEDVATTYKLVYKAKVIVHTTKAYYFYRKRQGSISSGFNIRQLDKVFAMKEKYQFFEVKGEEELKNYAMREYVFNILAYYYLLNKFKYDEKKYQFAYDYRKSFLAILRNPIITNRQRILLSISYLFPSFWIGHSKKGINSLDFIQSIEESR